MIRCNRRQILRAGMAASLAGFRARTARSQTHYPQRRIRVIVPFAAGGVGDAAIRVLAPRLEQKLGQKLVIEFEAGSCRQYRNARRSFGPRPTATRSWSRLTGNFVINQFLMKMPFDPLAALTPIAKLAEIPIVFFSNPSVPAHNLARIHRLCAGESRQIELRLSGNGSVNHLLVERLKQVADIEITHVPYRGSPPAMLAPLANEIQLFPIGLAVGAAHLGEGKLTALAVTTKERLPMLPGGADCGRSRLSRSRHFELVGHGRAEADAGRRYPASSIRLLPKPCAIRPSSSVSRRWACLCRRRRESNSSRASGPKPTLVSDYSARKDRDRIGRRGIRTPDASPDQYAS